MSIEILAGNLDGVIVDNGINAAKTYESSDGNYQVWELSEEEMKKLEALPDDKYPSFEWWRYSDGSNMGDVHRRYKINHRYIKAWDGSSRIEIEEENKELPMDERLSYPREYSGLMEYLCDELGASQPRNVCALCIDLAKQNKITMAELFKRYY